MKAVFSVGSLDDADGGPSRTVPALCQALEGAGVSTTIVTCVVRPRQTRPVNRVPVREVVYASKRLRASWGRPFRRALTETIVAQGADLLHDNGVWLQTNHAAATVARRLHVPLVISPRGMLEPWSLAHGVLKKQIAWHLFQERDVMAASLLHATSVMEAEHLRQLGLRQPIAVIGNGVVLPDPIGPRVPSAHDAPRTALFLSRIHPKKGLLTLVKAWSVLRPAEWRVLVAGPDEDGHQEEVRKAAQAAKLGDVFEFVGPVEGSRKRQLLDEADLFVLPTASENFGVVVAEALIAGLPVITTRGTPWHELESERCGWWIELGVAPLVEALRMATSMTDAQRQAMGERGQRWAYQRFAWPTLGEEMRAVYEWLLTGGVAPGTVHRD